MPTPVWTPSDSVLLSPKGAPTVDEYESFSNTITYSTVENPGKVYSVVLVPSEQNPSTVYISGNNVSGYYTEVFNNMIRYKTKKDPENEYIDVNNFRAIDLDKLEEVIRYTPDLTPDKTYTYTANAYDGQTLVDSKVYTRKVINNWDLNKTLLLQYINSTVITDPSLYVSWINSINSAVVKWRNSSNVEINWA